MICRTCLRAAAARNTTRIVPSQRFLSTTSTLRDPSTTPATTQPAASQPLSTPLSPAGSPALKSQASESAKKKVAPLVRSSVAAGTVLKGLNFEKNKADPVALPDDAYPEWLWGILKKEGEGKEGGGGVGDLFSKSKKQRRIAAKRLRKEQALNPDMLVPKVPVYEQTVDLKGGDGTVEGAKEAAEARGELTKAMRKKRRADIKERNFLGGLR